MKTGFLRPKNILKGTVRTVANIPGWFGLRFMRKATGGVVKLMRPMYSTPQAKRKETFEQAQARLGLSEQDILMRLKNLRLQSWIYAIAMILSLAYTVYLLFSGYFACILALGVSGLFCFKFVTCRFWLFQIQHRSLGCNLHEWLQGKVKKP